MKNAIIRFLHTFLRIIATFFKDSVNRGSDGIDEGDIVKVAFNVTLLCSAVAAVVQPLGLAPIYSHTDMEADSEEQILPWGNVWRMKYKALKKSVDAPIDEKTCRRIIQAQVKTTLERSNPSGFANIRFTWGGRAEAIIQIDEILNGDAYIYIFAIVSSSQYFHQKCNWKNRKNAPPTEVNTDDEDF